jgi:hypothetical protein
VSPLARYANGSSPRNGDLVVHDDDRSVVYVVAHWHSAGVAELSHPSGGTKHARLRELHLAADHA